jgi:hypothetical protein
MPDIHHAIQVAASTQTVTELVATAAGLRQWWAEDVETVADGCVSLGFFNRATVYRLRLEERGPAAVSWRCETGEEWQDTELLFSLRHVRAGGSPRLSARAVAGSDPPFRGVQHDMGSADVPPESCRRGETAWPTVSAGLPCILRIGVSPD